LTREGGHLGGMARDWKHERDVGPGKRVHETGTDSGTGKTTAETTAGIVEPLPGPGMDAGSVPTDSKEQSDWGGRSDLARVQPGSGSPPERLARSGQVRGS